MKTAPSIFDAVKGHFAEATWPSFPSGLAATLATLMRHMERSQWFSPAELAAGQHQQLVSLASYAQTHSPYFRQRLAAAGLTPQDLATYEGLARLPVITRRDLRLAGADLYCKTLPASHGQQGEAKTSGSTGEPVNVRKTSINSLFWQACMMREHMWHKRDYSQRLLAIRSHEFGFVRQAHWGNPLALFFPNGMAQITPITLDLSEQIKSILEFKPQHILTYPNNMDGLITRCEQEGIRIEGVENLWFFGETLTPRIRKRAEKFFGAHSQDNYSAQELGIMALQCPDSGLYHTMAESVIVEILDENDKPCAPGQTGRVVVTDLHNFSTPMIRYAVGDYAEAGAACSCGRGLPVLNAIYGRERNLLAKPGGVRHWPRINFDEYKHIKRITQYQLIQHTLDDLEVRLVAHPQLTTEEEAELTAHLHESMAYTPPIRFSYFAERIPTSPSGKFEEFISHCS